MRESFSLLSMNVSYEDHINTARREVKKRKDKGSEEAKNETRRFSLWSVDEMSLRDGVSESEIQRFCYKKYWLPPAPEDVWVC